MTYIEKSTILKSWDTPTPHRQVLSGQYAIEIQIAFLFNVCKWGGGGERGVSGKVYSEHIVATKVLMPMGGLGVWESVPPSGKEH